MSVFSSKLKYGHEIASVLIFLSFWLNFLSVFFQVDYLIYFIAISFVISLFLLFNLTPILFSLLLIFCFFLYTISTSPTLLASIFPILGFLFSGTLKFKNKPNYISSVLFSIYLFYIIYFLNFNNESYASHNYLSIILVYALVLEFLIFRSINKWFIPLILVSFFIFGNRSAIFLLLIFLRSKIVASFFLGFAVLFILMSVGKIEVLSAFQFLFDEGNLFYRSYRESRGDYFVEFMDKFDFSDLSYKNWRFVGIPYTLNGFYDLHNSFLTIIVRDSYLGIFKILLWISQIIFLPFGIFTGISMRAYYDSFLLGGVNDILIYTLIGQNLRMFFSKFKIGNI